MAILIVKKKNNSVKKFCSAAIRYDSYLTLFSKGAGEEQDGAPYDQDHYRQLRNHFPDSGIKA